MIKKIKATKSEKIIFGFLISLAIFFFGSYFLIKDKCLFVKNYDPQKISFDNPQNIVILNSYMAAAQFELSSRRKFRRIDNHGNYSCNG